MFMQNDASQETLQEIWQQTIPIIEYVLEHIDTISETRLKILNELIVLIAKRLETLPVDTSIMKRWSYLHLQLLHEILSDYTVQSNDFQTLLHQIPKLKVIHQLNCLFLMLVEKSCKTTVLCPILEVPLLLESIFKLSIQWTANETVGWLFVDHMLVEDTTILLKSSSRLLFGSLIKNMRIHQPCRKTMVESMLIPSFNSEAMNRTHRVRYQSDLIDFAAQSFTISIAVEEYSRLLAHIDKKFLAIHIQNSIIQFQGKVLLKELLSLLITISKHFATCDIVKSILQRGLTQSIVNMLKREWETSQDDIVYRLICILADWPLGVLELPVMQYELDWYQWMIMA
ncbi:hypothetical protein BC833DRAFT_561594 [Globomyces pollinis-pini]|nr:hypothetical protein BC833DRAFT_561594 [Globomyces pollinis-pini]